MRFSSCAISKNTASSILKNPYFLRCKYFLSETIDSQGYLRIALSVLYVNLKPPLLLLFCCKVRILNALAFPSNVVRSFHCSIVNWFLNSRSSGLLVSLFLKYFEIASSPECPKAGRSEERRVGK